MSKTNHPELILIVFFVDTTFMYVICILCTLKIYQSRHPDINAEAQEAFKVLAAVAVLCVFSLFIEDMLVFQIFVFFIHLFACLAISTRVYYMGTWKMSMFICLDTKSFTFWNKFLYCRLWSFQTNLLCVSERFQSWTIKRKVFYLNTYSR
jgi:hypothetical protein